MINFKSSRGGAKDERKRERERERMIKTPSKFDVKKEKENRKSKCRVVLVSEGFLSIYKLESFFIHQNFLIKSPAFRDSRTSKS